METAKYQKAVDDLTAENRAILEELAQCKADKDFVWNLWRRLQSTQPEVTSVVSMVIAREKEKSEQKDKKVLEILQMKDEKIKELKERMLTAEDESHYSKTRYHDLLIENEELKQKLDERQNEFVTKDREMNEENSYLSSLLKAHQAQKEIDDQTVKENLDHIEDEKNQLKIRIALLEKEVSDFREEKLNMASAIEVNATLEEKIKSLENEVSVLTLKSTEVAKNCDDAESKLSDKESLVKDQLESLKEQSDIITKLEDDLVVVDKELRQTRENLRQATAKISEQTRIIQQLEENQSNNQLVLMDREQEYRKGIASLQKSVADLQSRCAVYQENENKLLQDIDKLKTSSIQQKEGLNVKELIIEELKDAVRDGIRSGEVSRREEEGGMGDRRAAQRKVRVEAEVSEAGSPRFQREKEAESLEERQAERINHSVETIEESESEIARNLESMERKLGKITALRELENRLSESRNTVDELKKLLELKEAELVETRRAHSQRQQRYRMLKENYQLVLEQIKTYEASNGTGSEKPLPERPEERELRHLDSDQVWKELAYYKHGYEELAKERHDVLEEIDVLRVQHVHNVANIQELQVQLGEEREESSALRSKVAAGRQAFDTLRLETEKLENQLQNWQEKALRGQTMSSELEDENQLLRHEIKALQGENKSLAEEFSGLAEEFENLKKRYDEMVNKQINKKTTQLENPHAAEEVAVQTETKSKTAQVDTELAKQHVESLSSYDEQVRRIASRILSSPHKDTEEFEQTHNITTQGTQTDTFPRFVDSSVNVNLDAEDASSVDEEEVFDVKNSVKKSVVFKEGGVHRQGTPQPKRLVKRTPRRNEWASMKQRILSLTQEVSALRQTKDKAVKALNMQKNDYESLQTEYNALLSKLQVSRNSVQHLTDSLKLCAREKDLLAEELKEKNEIDSRPNALSIAEWKRLEEELRLATMECIRLASIVRTLGSENEQLRVKLKEVQEKCARLEHAVTQKKTLVDEMKSKMKGVDEKGKKDSETCKSLEERLSQLREREKTNKVRIETLEHRLDGEAREKQKYHQQLLSCQNELKKKAQQLTR